MAQTKRNHQSLKLITSSQYNSLTVNKNGLRARTLMGVCNTGSKSLSVILIPSKNSLNSFSTSAGLTSPVVRISGGASCSLMIFLNSRFAKGPVDWSTYVISYE